MYRPTTHVILSFGLVADLETLFCFFPVFVFLFFKCCQNVTADLAPLKLKHLKDLNVFSFHYCTSCTTDKSCTKVQNYLYMTECNAQ